MKSLSIYHKLPNLTSVASKLLKLLKESKGYKKCLLSINKWMDSEIKVGLGELKNAFTSYKRLVLIIHDECALTPLFCGNAPLSSGGGDETLENALFNLARKYLRKWKAKGGERYLEVLVYVVISLQFMKGGKANDEGFLELKCEVVGEIVRAIGEKKAFFQKGWKVKFISLVCFACECSHRVACINNSSWCLNAAAQPTLERRRTSSYGKVTSPVE